jgi:transcriptional regulator with XRE-family HTH domain
MKEGYGEFIKNHRIESGYKKQKSLADKTGISAATISRIENEIQRPEEQTLKILSQYLPTTSYVELMVACGYWDKEELLTSNFLTTGYDEDLQMLVKDPSSPLSVTEFLQKTGRVSRQKQTPASNEEEFVDRSIDLTDDEILDQFDFKIDGRSLTEDEATGIIAYVRSLRQLKK